MSVLKQYVLVYAISEKDTLPMVLKDRPEHLKGMLNMPGGKIEEGESAIRAARRELEEETGLKPWGHPELMGRILGTKSEIHVVKIDVREEPLQPRPDETEIFDWYDLKVYEDPKLMPNLRLVIPLCNSGAIGWTVNDTTSDWLGVYHRITLVLDKWQSRPIEITIPGVGFFKK